MTFTSSGVGNEDAWDQRLNHSSYLTLSLVCRLDLHGLNTKDLRMNWSLTLLKISQSVFSGLIQTRHYEQRGTEVGLFPKTANYDSW